MGKGGGKSTGKAILGIGMAAFGYMNPAAFGIGASVAGGAWLGALYGLSLGTTIWSTLNPEKQSNTSYFDYQMNSVAPNQMIPIIYGEHKMGGLQTYHYTNKNGKSMVKDIIIGEGEIEGVYGVCANNLIIDGGTIFKIYNVEYSDATVQIYKNNKPTKNDKVLSLYANGKTTNISLQASVDIEDDQSNDFSCSVDKLINYINGYGYNNGLAEQGWRTTEVVAVSSDPEKIYDLAKTKCYNNPVEIKTNGLPDCSYTFNRGTSAPDNYMKVGGYKNCAWIRAHLKKSDELPSSGNPNITSIVKGRRVVDTRKSYSARKYSTNPAMIVRDYLLEERFGCGKFITADMLDEESFREVADYCDELIEYKDISGMVLQEPRYTLNIVLTERRKHIDNLNDMFAVFGGFLVFTNNKISLRCEKEEIVSHHFDENSIVLGSVSFSQSALSDTPNKYQIGYCDHNYNHSEIKVVIDDYADQVERGVIITKDITLKGCNRQTQAKRLGRLYKSLNRLCSVTMQFRTTTTAMHLEPGDIVTISYKNLFKDQPARITEMQEDKGVWTIKAQQYNASIYRDSYMEQIELHDYSPIENAFSGSVPNVTELSAAQSYYQSSDGKVVSDITLSFISPDYQFLKAVNILYSLDGVKYTELGMANDGMYVMHNAVAGKTYYFKAVVENTLGRKSSGEIIAVTVTGKDEPPALPVGIATEKRKGGVLLSWTANKEPDISGYNIYVSPNNTGLKEEYLYNEQYKGTSLYVPLEQNIMYGLYVVAVDNSGNHSMPAVTTYIASAPPDVEWFDCVVIDSDLDFRWRGESGLNFEIRRGDSWETGTKIAESSSNAYRTLFPSTGEHSFWIKAFDEYRNYSINPVKAIVSILGTENRNIIEVVDQVENGWEGGLSNAHVDEYGYLRLDKGCRYAEHLVNVSMPKEFKLRNWIDYSLKNFGDDSLNWDNAMFSWDSAEAKQTWVPVADLTPISCKHYIAVGGESYSDTLYNFRLFNNTNGGNGETANEAFGITYEPSHYATGVLLKDTTYLGWNVEIPSVFSNMFSIAKNGEFAHSSVFMTYKSGESYLQVGYDYETGSYYCKDNYNRTVSVSINAALNDHIMIGIIQSADTRTIFAKSSLTGDLQSNSFNIKPIGDIDYVCCY